MTCRFRETPDYIRLSDMPRRPQPPTLGTCIKHRREQLRVSVAEAARRAGVPRSTWIAWEKDIVPKQVNHARIEDVLEWQTGSVAAIIAGQPPMPIRERPLASVTELHPGSVPRPPDDELVKELRAMDMDDESLERMIAAYWAEKSLEDAQRQQRYRIAARRARG
jgi:transcriptional regulator with XRE-family HTH domain